MIEKLPKIGVLGGTFNPVHFGHLSIALAALEQLKLDKLFIIPTGEVWYKTATKGADSSDRVNMLKLAFMDIPETEILSIEIDKVVSGYTFETIPYLKNNIMDGDYYYIFGQDCLRDFGSWKNPDLICKEASIAYAKREGVKDLETTEADRLALELSKRYNSAFIPLVVEESDISSSDIRNRVKSGDSLDDLMPKAVSQYIHEKGLYLD